MPDILLINLGKGNPAVPTGYEETEYAFPDGWRVRTSLAGLALWKWLESAGRAPVSVCIACTEAAWRDKRDAVLQEAHQLQLPKDYLAGPIHLKLPRSLDEVWGLLGPVERWIKSLQLGPGAATRLNIDLTHAYRAIPIVHTWLALYLQRLGLVELGVMGYGAYDPAAKESTPYIDLSHMMWLAEWAAAVRDLERRGDAGALMDLLERFGNLVRKQTFAGAEPPDPKRKNALRVLGSVTKAAQAISRHIPAGLPIELGIEARRALGSTGPKDVADAVQSVLPPAAPVAERLHRAARLFAWPDELTAKQAKRNLKLSHAEIRRELDLVGLWAKRRAEGGALRALRELIINRVLLARGIISGWLDESARKRAAEALNQLRQVNNPRFSSLPEDRKKLGRLWHEVCEMRNAFAHAGMKPDEVHVENASHRIAGFVERFRELDRIGDGLWRLVSVSPRR
jgi:hypothetical protein